MKALSLDLRERVVAAYQAGGQSQRQVARRFGVAQSVVCRLCQQQQRERHLRPRYGAGMGRPPVFTAARQRRLCQLVARQPDLTLAELRRRGRWSCSLPTIHHALRRAGLSLKKNAGRHRAGAGAG